MSFNFCFRPAIVADLTNSHTNIHTSQNTLIKVFNIHFIVIFTFLKNVKLKKNVFFGVEENFCLTNFFDKKNLEQNKHWKSTQK